MPYATDHILENLRSARLQKGISQRDLGTRVGLPQSHISKIEKGGSDLKLSSLVELARALDLEVQLVPRSALPVIETILRDATQERAVEGTSRALDLIRRTQNTAASLASVEPLLPQVAELQQRLEELKRFRFDSPSLSMLSKALAPIEHVRKRLSQLDLPNERLGGWAKQYIEPIKSSSHALAALRNQLAHSPPTPENDQLPAYRLDDDE